MPIETNNQVLYPVEVGMPVRQRLGLLVQQINATPYDQKIPVFWDKSVSYTGGGQASIAALYREGLLDCTGKPGSMKWFIGSRYLLVSKVNSTLKVSLTFLFMFVFLLPHLMMHGSQETVVLAGIISVFAFFGYFYKGVMFASYRALLTAIPGNTNFYLYCLKSGMYNCGWAACIGFAYVAYRKLDSGGLAEVGYITSIANIIEGIGINLYAMFYQVLITNSDGFNGRVFVVKMIGAPMLIALFAGLILHVGTNPSVSLLRKHGQYDRYVYQGQSFMPSNPALLFGLLLLAYFVIRQVRLFW